MPTEASQSLRCVAMPEPTVLVPSGWLSRWQAYFADRPLALKPRQLEAIGGLIPSLLCGEQSAVTTFHAEARRLSRDARLESARLFHRIESDERSHEAGLQALLSKVPPAADLHAVKRRAQRFFAGLGRAESVAQHFSQIAQLDRAVCIIMWHIEHSDAGADDAVRIIARQIKRDEARHVSISRRHARALGASADDHRTLGEKISAGLGGLLEPVADRFEAIGIDFDHLARRIRYEALQ